MLSSFMQEFTKELELNKPFPQDVPGVYKIPLEADLSILITTIPEGISFTSNLAQIPKGKEESFYTHALLGNLFGQGTKGAVLGLTDDGRMLTLSHLIDYDINYKEFKETLEDFINSVDFWRKEALNYQT